MPERVLLMSREGSIRRRLQKERADGLEGTAFLLIILLSSFRVTREISEESTDQVGVMNSRSEPKEEVEPESRSNALKLLH